MGDPDASATKLQLQHFRACLGVCRHCLEATTTAEVFWENLSDIVLALEVTVAMLESSEICARARLGDCAHLFEAWVQQWAACDHLYCQQSIGACEVLLRYLTEGAAAGDALSLSKRATGKGKAGDVRPRGASSSR
jgi:hypothetical protein